MEENRQPCSLPDEKELQDLADLFKVFGDATRIRILLSMYDGERAVSEIADAVGMSTSAVSHQLKILRSAGLVRARRDGKQIFYSLADEHVHTIIGVGRDHIEE
ncbi:MAG: ArsR/SmtB family transcription factor [Lachnospiraceae bacterium]